MGWNGKQFFHIPYLQFSFISFPFHTKILFRTPYQGKFRPEAVHNLYCTFPTLSVPLEVVICEGKQYSTMHLIPFLKHDHNERPEKFTQYPGMKISTTLISRQ